MEQNSRHDWQERQIIEILQKPFNDLIFEAQTVHRQYFNPNVTILMQFSYRHSSQLRPGRVLKIVNIVPNPLTTKLI